MKIGIRKPSVKKRIKAATTGKVKRAVKKSVNPLYGKKGMGVINDPKKAAYNAVYSKTTIDATDIHVKKPKNNSTDPNNKINQDYSKSTNRKNDYVALVFFVFIAVVVYKIGAWIGQLFPTIGYLSAILCICFVCMGIYLCFLSGN